MSYEGHSVHIVHAYVNEPCMWNECITGSTRTAVYVPTRKVYTPKK